MNKMALEVWRGLILHSTKEVQGEKSVGNKVPPILRFFQFVIWDNITNISPEENAF
jgi:hypothetical protein